MTTTGIIGRWTREDKLAAFVELCEFLTEDDMREAFAEVSPMTRDIMHDVITDLEDEL